MDYFRRCFSKYASLRIRSLQKVRDVQKKEWQKYVFPAIVIAIVWGLMLLPIIVHNLPNKQESENGSGRSDNVDVNLSPPFTSGSGSTDSGGATQSCTIDCHDQFYCENNICKPRCDNFRENSYEYTVFADVLVGLVHSIGILCGIAILVITCLRPKRMYVIISLIVLDVYITIDRDKILFYRLAFPTILIIYMIITLLVFGFVVLLTILNRPALYCRLNDLVTSIQNPTPYCTISGFIAVYSLTQFTLLWAMHISFIFLKIYFPMSIISKNIQSTKYVHVISLITVLLLPLISPIILHMKDGFVMSFLPPFFCVGKDGNLTFYTHHIPIIIFLGVGISLLVLIFWRLHMRNKLFQPQPGMGTAERKVLLVFTYYILVGVFVLTSSAVLENNEDRKYAAFAEYLQCEANGRNNTCIYDTQHFESAMVLSINVLLGLTPAIILVFAINVSEAKAFSKQAIKKLSKTLTFSTKIEPDV